MLVHRLLGPVFLALAVAGPHAAAAQTPAPVAPNSLAAQTKAYFTALLHADETALSSQVSSSFHLVLQDGTRVDFPKFVQKITDDYFTKINPMGVDVHIRASNETASHASETVDTTMWWYGGDWIDPMSAPVTERAYATHQLTWTKSPDGTWLLDEDHITEMQDT